MMNIDDWEEEFKGPEFDDMSTEFHYTKLCKEIDAVDDVKVLRDMLKQYIKIHLKEKEMWKKLTKTYIAPINTDE